MGNGPDRERLQALAQQLGVADRCRSVNAVLYDVMPLRTTTHWKERFDQVLVEAMACQTDVAGPNSGTIPEVIGDPN